MKCNLCQNYLPTLCAVWLITFMKILKKGPTFVFQTRFLPYIMCFIILLLDFMRSLATYPSFWVFIIKAGNCIKRKRAFFLNIALGKWKSPFHFVPILANTKLTFVRWKLEMIFDYSMKYFSYKYNKQSHKIEIKYGGKVKMLSLLPRHTPKQLKSQNLYKHSISN